MAGHKVPNYKISKSKYIYMVRAAIASEGNIPNHGVSFCTLLYTPMAIYGPSNFLSFLVTRPAAAQRSATAAAGMDSLPGDVVADVLALLPPCGLAVSRCVCKAWRATVDASGLLRADLLPLTVGGVFTHVPHELQPPQFIRRPSKGRPKILAGDLSYVRTDAYYGIELQRVADCCNGLLLLNNCVVNPATRRWARLPPCPPLPAAGRGCTDGREGYLLFDDGHLLFDPAVSPHYQVLGLPYLVSVDQLKKKFAEGQLVAWPPSPWTVQVFSSGTQRWENRSIVREGEAIAIPDLVQLALQQPSSISHCYNAYWHGSLYIHFNEGFIVRYRLSYIKTLHTSRRRFTHLLC